MTLKWPFALVPLALLAGCAAAPPVMDSLPAASRLAVLQLSPSVRDDQLRHVLHADDDKIAAATLAADRRNLQNAARAALIAALAGSPQPSLAEARLIPLGSTQDMVIGRPLDAASLAALQAQRPADAYLRLRVTDYGQTPGKWKSAYVTFEVVTTLAIGGALYVNKTTRPLAGLYLLQEGVEEYSEGFAGWWLLNRLSRPVRIEADLVDGRTGAVLWQDSDTGLAGWTWGHLWHMDAATRRGLLQVSTDKAIEGLLREVGGGAGDVDAHAGRHDPPGPR